MTLGRDRGKAAGGPFCHADRVRFSVACPSCDVTTQLLVVGGKTRSRCPRCEALFDVGCVACGFAPEPTQLTGDVDAPGCRACHAPLALLASPAPDRGRTSVGEPRWDDVLLVESGGESPYRNAQPTRLCVQRRPGRTRRWIATWALASAPGIVPAAIGWWWAGAGWASAMAVMLLAGTSPIRAMEVSPSGVRVLRSGLWNRVCAVDAERVRRVGWGGRGARCHVFLQTHDRSTELLFDGLTPPQAEVLEGKIARLLGV